MDVSRAGVRKTVDPRYRRGPRFWADIQLISGNIFSFFFFFTNLDRPIWTHTADTSHIGRDISNVFFYPWSRVGLCHPSKIYSNMQNSRSRFDKAPVTMVSMMKLAEYFIYILVLLFLKSCITNKKNCKKKCY